MQANKPNWWIAETGAWIAVNKPFGLSVEKTLGAFDTIEPDRARALAALIRAQARAGN